jgi:hypothetical protein
MGVAHFSTMLGHVARRAA